MLQCVDVVDRVACLLGVHRVCLEAFLHQRFAALGSKPFLFLSPLQLGKGRAGVFSSFELTDPN